jgi:glutamate/tyrosine decarboxylase-like PLP-dependent enzyme
MLQFPSEASGLLVSGCSIANLIGLTVARNVKSEVDIRRSGLSAVTKRMTVYASEDVHSSIQKGVELLGLGSDALRLIPIDDDFKISLPALRKAIQQDRAAGHFPFCIVGCAGTTATGAIDDLTQLASICREESLWFHVDGAFGALVTLSPNLQSLVSGMNLADSLAFDFHKWMYMPHAVGCILIRRKDDHLRAFALTPDYLDHGEDNPLAGEDHWFGDYGIELSSEFRALKVWFSIKVHGIEAYGRLIQRNVEQARYLAEKIQNSPNLELLAPVALNIVCFRFKDDRIDGSELDDINKRLLIRLQAGGVVMISNTTILGKYALRAAITNHRSHREDFDILVNEVIKQGNYLLQDDV